MNNLQDIAQRIVNIDLYEARNNDMTPESLAEALKSIENCYTTITYLLDIIDDLT